MNTSLKVFQVKVTNTGAMCPLMNEGMKPWCKYSDRGSDLVGLEEPENWYQNQAPQRFSCSDPFHNWLLGMTSLLSLSFELWTKLCLQTSRKYHSLLFLSAQVSFFNLAKIPICLENLLHIFRTAPYLCVSPLWPLWSSPWLPLWLSVSLEFWELIINWRKSTRGCKQKEISMKESYLWSHRQIRSAVFNLFPERIAPYRAEVWLVLPESSVN